MPRTVLVAEYGSKNSPKCGMQISQNVERPGFASVASSERNKAVSRVSREFVFSLHFAVFAFLRF